MEENSYLNYLLISLLPCDVDLFNRYCCLCLILLNLIPVAADVMDSLNEWPIVDVEKPQEGNECLLKLIYPRKLLQTLTLKCIGGCFSYQVYHQT